MTNVGSTPNGTNTSQESPTQKADDVRGPFDGPHARGSKKDQNSSIQNSSEGDAPAYVVAVGKQDKSDDDGPKVPKKYDPRALQAKARGLLNNKNIGPEQRRVLREILGPEEDSKKESFKTEK
jgi:hypothetical protein